MTEAELCLDETTIFDGETGMVVRYAVERKTT